MSMFKNTKVFSSYSIDDVQKALEFYKNTLDLDASLTPEGVILNLNGSTVFLYPKSDHTSATFTVLNFQVEDINLAVDS